MRAVQERRIVQRDRLVEAAERAVAGQGLAHLKARDLAQEVGVSLGSIYNLVTDLDDLVLKVIRRTLSRLDADLAMAADAAAARPPEDRLIAIALAYRRFASANLNLWRGLFEYQPPADRELPDWVQAEQMRLFRHIHAPLQALRPGLEAPARNGLALALFGAVHGVVALGLEGRVVGVPVADLDTEITRLVRLFAAGLAGAGPAMFTSRQP